MKIMNYAAAALLAIMGAGTARAEVLTANPLTIKDIRVVAGEAAELVMDYNTDEQYIGLQFELTLPEGVNFAMDPEQPEEVDLAITNTKLAKTHFLTAKVHADGLYKAVFVSLRNDVIKSGDWLLKIPLVVSADFEGTGVGSIKGCRFATTTHEDQYLTPEYFKIYVESMGLTAPEAAGADGGAAYDLQGRRVANRDRQRGRIVIVKSPSGPRKELRK